MSAKFELCGECWLNGFEVAQPIGHKCHDSRQIDWVSEAAKPDTIGECLSKSKKN